MSEIVQGKGLEIMKDDEGLDIKGLTFQTSLPPEDHQLYALGQGRQRQRC